MTVGENKDFYLTTPIYYVNDAPHIGHAYTTVAGDVLTRWHRQRGEGVWFLTGTDEHGEKVMNTAKSNNVEPQDWCDRLVESAWKPLWKSLNIANDDFIRTTEERHEKRVQAFLQNLKDKGFIYSGKYEGPYCIGCEEFKLPGDLDDGKCTIHGKPVEMLSEENWFFKLSEFAPKLIEHYKQNPEACEPATIGRVNPVLQPFVFPANGRTTSLQTIAPQKSTCCFNDERVFCVGLNEFV